MGLKYNKYALVDSEDKIKIITIDIYAKSELIAG